MFPFFVLLYAILTNSIYVIDNIWNDDFVSDSQGLNGWHIYYNDQEYDTIPFINGTLGKYHGIYEYPSVSTHYLKRTFQCKNDSSIRLGYMMAFCGNEITDKTQVHLNTGFAFLVDFISANRLYPFQDTAITSNITCGTGYRWYVYYNVASAKVLQSFIAGQLSFDIKIEVKLSANSDRAVINNITLFCDPPIPTAVPTSTPSVSTIAPTLSPVTSIPTASPTTKPNVIIDIWNDDFLYDANGLYGWEKLYIDNQAVGNTYTPDTNPLIYGEYTYHGIYTVYVFRLEHILYRLFKCLNDSEIVAQYSVAYCGNKQEDFIQIDSNNNFQSSLLTEGNTFTDKNVTNGSDCLPYAWIYRDYVTSLGSIQGMIQFELQFKYIISLVDEFGALYNISIRCNPILTSQPTTANPTTVNPTTTVPTTSNPTTTAPTTIIPTTIMPTTSNPTTTAPTTIIPTTIMPTTFSPTTKNPTTNVPTTRIPTTVIPTTVFPTTNNPTTTVPTTIIPTTITPTTSMPTAFTPTTAPMTTIPTSNSPTFISPTSLISSSLINSMDELEKESNIESMGNILMFIVIGIVTLLVSFLICFVSYKIYTKKQRSNVDETECVSHVEMNIKLTKDENTIKNMNGKPVNEESKNSYEEMYDKAIMSLSTKGETLTEGAISTDIESRGNMSDNMLIKNEVNDENENHILFKQNTTDMIDIHNTEIDDNDRSDTEKMFDTNTQNITTPGGMENELYTTNGPVIEGYIANKEEDSDNDDIYIQSNVQTTKGNDV